MVRLSSPDWEKIIGKEPLPSAFEQSRLSLVDALGALAHPLRLQLLLLCSRDSATTTDTLKKTIRYKPERHAPHLERLRDARLLHAKKEDTNVVYEPGEERSRLDFVMHFLHAFRQRTAPPAKQPPETLQSTDVREKDLLEHAAATFSLLHNEVRIRILLTLMQQESEESLHLPTYQLHLHQKILQEAGLINYRQKHPVLRDNKDTRIATQLLEEIVLNMHGIHTQTDLNEAIGNK